MAENGKKGFFTKILFILGVLIVIILLVFAVIRFVPMVVSSLGNLGSAIGSFITNADEIEVSANTTEIKNGERFLISYDYKGADSNGTYSISYSCEEDLSLRLSTPNGLQTLLCNTPYNVLGKSLEFTAILASQNIFRDVDINIAFTPSGETSSTANGSITVTVSDGAIGTNSVGIITSQPINSGSNTNTSGSTNSNASSGSGSNSGSSSNTNSGSNSGTTYYSTYSGLADLQISNVISVPNLARIQFDVTNIGGQASGPWYFSYTDPNDNQTKNSPLQISLGSSQALRITLAFENDFNSKNVLIFIDPQNQISEKSESNNSFTTLVTGNGNNSNNSNGGSNYRTISYDEDDDADLDILDLEVGYLSGNRFIEDDRLDDNDDLAIRFTVGNRGGDDTGRWRFELNDLPYSDDNYRSDRQNSLDPGEVIEIIVEFNDRMDDGDFEIRLEVDSDDDVDEERENNNRDIVDLEVRD